MLKRHVPRCSGGVGTNQLTPRGAKVATRNAKTERDRTGSLIPEPKAAGAPPAGQATDRGVWGEQNLSAPPRSPAPWESGQGAAGRPPLGPGCATAPRAPAGDERVAGEDRRQRDSRTREGRAAPGRYPIGGRRPRERDGAPPQGTRRHRELHGPRRTRELSLSRPVRARLSLHQACTARRRCPARRRRPHRREM